MRTLKIVAIVGSLLVFATSAVGTAALAKKNGSEVRNEPPPSGRAYDIDDRQAKSGTSGRDEGASSGSGGPGSGSGGSKGGQGEVSGDLSHGSDGSGASGHSGTATRVVIRDDDRF